VVHDGCLLTPTYLQLEEFGLAGKGPKQPQGDSPLFLLLPNHGMIQLKTPLQQVTKGAGEQVTEDCEELELEFLHGCLFLTRGHH